MTIYEISHLLNSFDIKVYQIYQIVMSLLRQKRDSGMILGTFFIDL